MTIRRISITFVALLFATISFGQVKSIDERIGEAMNSSNWAELRSLYMSDGKNLQTPFLKPLSRFFISQFTTVRRNFLRQGFNCLNSITYKAQNIFRLELRNFAVGNKTPSASHEQRKNNLRANYVSH